MSAAGTSPDSRAWYLRRTRRRTGARRAVGWLVVLILAILFIFTLWLLRSRLPESFSRTGRALSGDQMSPVGAFELYFGDPAARGLQREIRYLLLLDSPERQMREVIATLIEGSWGGGLSPWASGTTLRDLFVTNDGIIYVDFEESLRTDAPPGDYMEWLLIASLTRTLCANFPNVRGVRIMVAGKGSGPLVRTIPMDWIFTPAMFDDAG
jgi:hypothetical protein